MPFAKFNSRSTVVIFIPLIFFSYFLEIVRLPAFVSAYRPDFLLLVLLFFAVYDPKRYSIEVAFICGLILDLLNGAPLASNGLLCAFVLFLIKSQFKKFNQYSKLQQAFIVGVINFLVHIVIYWIEHIIVQITYDVKFLIPSIVTGVFCPLVFLLCAFLCKLTNVVVKV